MPTGDHSASPKFAFISSMEGVPWGGSEELWAGAAGRLLQNGHRIVVCTKDWGVREPASIRQMARDGAIMCPRPGPTTLTTAQRVWQALRRRMGLPKREITPMEALVREQPAFALVSSGGSLPPEALCRPLWEARIPYAVLVHAASEQWWPSDDVRENGLAVLRSARTVMFVSNENRRLISRQLVHEHPDTRIVRNPYRASFTEGVPWPGDGPPWRLAVVGRLDPAAKGTDLVIEVLSRTEWRDRPVEVTFVGEGPAHRGLEALVAARGLENARFLGWTEDVPGVWSTHHALLLPSRLEGLPLAIVEAMLAGRPCIVTDVGGNTELVEDGHTGFVAAAPTIALVADALERAWAARGRWSEIGAAAAGVARARVPSDPIGEFARLLLEIAARAGK